MEREVVFSSEEFEGRIHRVRKVMEKWGVDTLIVHHPANIYYLCGHNTLNIWDYQCLVVPIDSKPFMVLWQFERGRFEASSSGVDAIFFENGESPVNGTLRALKLKDVSKGTIGLEFSGGYLTPEVFLQIKNGLNEARFLNISGITENVAAIKSESELNVMR